MIVHDLQFRDLGHLTRSVNELLDAEGVEDCLIEAEELRLRFVAPRRLSGSLLERIYLYGGLTWCSRHPLKGARAHPGG
ncbi:MAG: hypothetical protein ACQGVK_16115 [Myxococcota bacterium]